MKKSLSASSLLILTTFLLIISLTFGPTNGRELRKKKKPAEVVDLLDIPYQNDGEGGPPLGARQPPLPKLDPYRCDHFHDFKKTGLEEIFKAKEDFISCCSSYPRGTFTCPGFAPPGHVCGLPNPPNCCICPPTTTTTSTTTKSPQEDEDEEEEDEEEEEEEEDDE